MRAGLIIAALCIAGCGSRPPGYCAKLVESYEQCRANYECWGNRRHWATASYMNDLIRCNGLIARGQP